MKKRKRALYDDYWTEEDRDKYFAYGFPIHFIDPNREKWWEPFYHYAHYKEVSDAISLFQLQVTNHHKGETIEIVPGHSLPDFGIAFK